MDNVFPPDPEAVPEIFRQRLADADFVSNPHVRLPRRRVGPSVISVALFVATCASTFLTATVFFAPPDPVFDWPARLWDGLMYSGPIMLILLCHEMGHFLTARFHHVPASPPFFLPLPLLSPLGTMGAVIVQPRGFGDRRTMFDIAVMGPLAGFVVALPVAWFGVQYAELLQFDPQLGRQGFGDPLLLKAMIWLRFGDLPPNHDILLNPLLFAGWAGLFLTGLNLVPIGQLDGGHIMYALLGRGAHRVAQGILLLAVGYMIWYQEPIYTLMIVLLLMTGIKHPPTTNDRVPLGWKRTLLGWSTMMLFFVCFTAFPMFSVPPETENGPVLPPPAPVEAQPEAELVVRFG